MSRVVRLSSRLDSLAGSSFPFGERFGGESASRRTGVFGFLGSLPLSYPLVDRIAMSITTHLSLALGGVSGRVSVPVSPGQSLPVLFCCPHIISSDGQVWVEYKYSSLVLRLAAPLTVRLQVSWFYCVRCGFGEG